MTNIQPKEYVRTKDGDIFKLAEFYDRAPLYSMQDENGILYGNPNKVVKKHSFNIIDLIEVGDYVNGKMVDETTDGTLGIVIVDQFIPINEVEIRSVVTIEQFRKVKVDIK